MVINSLTGSCLHINRPLMNREKTEKQILFWKLLEYRFQCLFFNKKKIRCVFKLARKQTSVGACATNGNNQFDQFGQAVKLSR